VRLSKTNKNVIFFFHKIIGQEDRTDPVWVVDDWYQWEGEDVGKGWEGEYGANVCTGK
jgi:hypothetical protein